MWETTTGVRGGEGRNFATGSRGKLHRDNEYTQGSSGWFKIIIFFLGPSTKGKNRLFNHHPRIAPVLCEIGVSGSPEMGIGQSGDSTMWETMDFGDSSIIVAPVAEIMKQPGRKASIK